ncbi:MAG: hypothetical protein ACK4P2_10690 [Hyphomonas sp.]
MEADRLIALYARLYAGLLAGFPGEQQRRFAREREQLFRDRLRERARQGRPIWPEALWMCGETLWTLSGDNMDALIKKHQGTLIAAGVTLALLMVPLIAMRYTDDVQWTLFDFAVAGSALFVTGIAFNLFLGRTGNLAYRSAAAIALGATLLHFWANSAVGMIGPETDDFNRAYHLIWILGLAGAAFARLRPGPMSYVMLGMALGHAGLGWAALELGKQGESPSGTLEIFSVTGAFSGLFLLSAWLFSEASGARTDGMKRS